MIPIRLFFLKLRHQRQSVAEDTADDDVSMILSLYRYDPIDSSSDSYSSTGNSDVAD